MAWPAVVGAIAGAALPAIGGIIGTKINAKESAKARRYKRLLDQNQISWRVADAKRAGIHPLAALGISPASGFNAMSPGSELASGMSKSGQNIQRSMSALKDPHTKAMNKLAEESLQQQVIGQKINNAAALLDYSRPQNESPGIKDNADQLVNEVPQEVIKSSPSNIGVQAGVRSLEDLFVDKFGTVTFELTQAASEPRESASAAKKLKTSAYDTAMLAKLAGDEGTREKLKKLIINELRRTNRLKRGYTVYWNSAVQEFQVRKLKRLSDKKYLKKYKGRKKTYNRYMKPMTGIMQ